jgi:uncharacterized Ntn-hydrolase superfamily protein
MTFTVVARCPATGQLGVAMATRAPAVGNRCPVVVPGYGAGSVQLIADPRLTQLCGRLIAAGLSAPQVIEQLRANDPRSDRRQVGVVDAYGRVAAWSAPGSSGFSGHVLGHQFLAMGNAVVSPQVVDAMAEAMTVNAGETLSDRLMRAVEAGGAAGGQAEGQFSACILVFGHEPFAILDLRVDFRPDPIAELRRIYDWFRPLIPYYQRRAYDPDIAREDHWREGLSGKPEG